MNKESRERIIIFYRRPREGGVKTRIAESAGPKKAEELYRAMLRDLRLNLGPFWPQVVPMAEGLLPGEETCWPATLPQEGEDLGQRMENALRLCLRTGARRCVLIGSDIPHITPEIAAGALYALRSSDAVLGPARDGGYYLVGLSGRGLKRHDKARGEGGPGLFGQMPWGTGGVFQETVRRAEALGLSVWTGPELEDLDSVESIERVLREAGPERLPSLSRAMGRAGT